MIIGWHSMCSTAKTHVTEGCNLVIVAMRVSLEQPVKCAADLIKWLANDQKVLCKGKEAMCCIPMDLMKLRAMCNVLLEICGPQMLAAEDLILPY